MNVLQLTLTDELFHINSMHLKPNPALTNENEIETSMQESAQELLNHYVRIQGLNVSQVREFFILRNATYLECILQMLRKSVETRDWLHTIEPRTVRAVMKRVVEDIAAIETTIALFYEDQGTSTEHSSDSSRKQQR